MSDEGIEVLLLDDGNGTRHAIPMSELAQFRLPDDLDLDEDEVEGFQITNPYLPHSSAARVRGPVRYDPLKGWGLMP